MQPFAANDKTDYSNGLAGHMFFFLQAFFLSFRVICRVDVSSTLICHVLVIKTS